MIIIIIKSVYPISICRTFDNAESTELDRSALSMPLSALRFSGLGHAAGVGPADDEGPEGPEGPAAVLSSLSAGASFLRKSTTGMATGSTFFETGMSRRSRNSSLFFDNSSSSR